ncbi:hypothetical protein IWW37_006137, partial [Coemansia sp. RSA 2050]
HMTNLIAGEDEAVIAEWTREQHKLTAQELQLLERRVDSAQAEEEQANKKLAEDDFKRVAELDVYRKAKKDKLEALRETYQAGVKEATEEFAAIELRVASDSVKQQEDVEKLAQVTATAREDVELATFATNQGYGEKFWEKIGKRTGPKPQANPTKPTMAQIVAGAHQKALIAMADDDEEQRITAAKIREFGKLSQKFKSQEGGGFYSPVAKVFKPLSEKEQEEALKDYGAPAANITHKGLTLIALGKRSGMFDKSIGTVRQRLVNLLHADMTVHNIAAVNSVTVEIVVPAEHYTEMCWRLKKEGSILNTDELCYVTTTQDRSQEQTPESVLRRWTWEMEKSKSPAGHEWYREALDRHRKQLRKETRDARYIPLMERRLLSGGKGPAPTDPPSQTDSDGSATQGKRTMGDRSTVSADSDKDRRYNQRFAMNRFAPLEADDDSAMEDQASQSQSTGHLQNINGSSPSQGFGGSHQKY